jgi:hypothetical protein
VAEERVSPRTPDASDAGRRGQRAAAPKARDQLRVELEHLKAELRVKDEYIEYLASVTPDLERGLRRVLADERRRTRRREVLRGVPVVGTVAAWAAREGRRLRKGR